MKLSDLLPFLHYEKVLGDASVWVEDLSADSRTVEKDGAFFCYRGQNNDLHDYAGEAVERGASVIFVETALDVDVTQVLVKNGREAMTECARAFFGFPDKKLQLVAVTGTNGKTTTTYLLHSIAQNAGKKSAVVGTLGIRFGEYSFDPVLTTPDPIFLYRTFAKMAEVGVEYVFMEVSAHSLYYKKIKGLNFAVGILTNCTQDHLDFFGNMKSYAAQKKSLFLEDYCRYKLVNVDDDLGLDLTKESNRVLTYGIKNPADVFAVDVDCTIDGSRFVLNTFDAVCEVKLLLPALHNVYNAMAAAGAAALLGFDECAIAKGLSSLERVSGRLERVATYRGGTVFVDFAHTPDGLEKTLSALKPMCRGRLILVVGCGGNRDKTKRPIMGAVACRYADYCIFTSDNPRFEDPYDIIAQMIEGIHRDEAHYIVITDRMTATAYALQLLQEGDILLVAGKGGENYQDRMGIKYPYNDNTVIKTLIG